MTTTIEPGARNSVQSVTPQHGLDFAAFDADNHYYEAHRRLHPAPRPEAGARASSSGAEIDGRKYHVIGGKVSHAVVNPTFDPVSPAGALSDVLPRQPRRSQPDGIPAASASRSARSTATATPGCQAMDEQGLPKIWLFPTLGMIYEELLKHDPEGGRR